MFVVEQDETQILNVNLSNEWVYPYFIFSLSGNGLTEPKYFFVDADLSKSPRVVRFSIEENDTEDLFDGIVSLPEASDLYCTIYNTNQNSELTIPSSDPIWKGLFRVKNSTTTTNGNEIERNYYGYDPR